MDKLNPRRALRAGLSRLSAPLLRDLSTEHRHALAAIAIAGVVLVSKNYALTATGTLTHVGPLVTALIGFLVAMPIMCRKYRPSLRDGRRLWRPALLMGVNLGVNNVALLAIFWWLRPQLVSPLSFLV